MFAAFRRLCGRRPLFLLACGMVAVVGLYHFEPWLAWLGGMLCALLATDRGGWKAGVAVGLLVLAVVGRGRMLDARQEADEAFFAGLGSARVEARLVEDATGEGGRWSAVARLHGGKMDDRKVRWIGSGEPPPAGTELKASGVFKPLEEERNPGTPDRAQRLRNEGVVADFPASGMRAEQWIGPVSLWGAGVKKAFREGIVAGLDENGLAAKVILAVVIGEKAKDSLGLMRDFRESGTLHVFSVSGMHVMMLGGLVWFALKWAGVPRRVAIPVIIATMFGYTWLTGNGSAAVRAAWMGAVFLGGFAFRRRTDLLNALGAVLVVSLLWDPRMIRMPGVQLSYGVVAAIGLGAGLGRRCFGWMAEEEAFLPASELGFWQRKWLWLRRKTAEALAVSTAASVGSLPLTAFHFGLVTPVSVIATVALVPMVYVLMGVALFSSVLHPFSEKAAALLNRGNAFVAQATAGTAGYFAGLPGASSPIGISKEDSLVIYDLDYGASAACFAPGAGNSVLIDTGGKFSLEYELGPSLMKLGMRPDSAILTHADARHAAPPEMMLEMFPLRQAASGMTAARGSVGEMWADFGAENVRVIHPGEGNLLDFGGGAWGEVLLSVKDGHGGSLADDGAMVLRLHWKGWKILFVGDAGRMGEEALLDSGVDLESDVIVAGMHESDLSLTEPFVAAVDPQAIVVARPTGCEMDVHRGFQMKAWRKDGISVIEQAETGGITVTVGADGELTFRGFADNSETLLRKR